MWDATYPYLAALLPTIGILALFFVVIRNVLSADRQERKAQAEWEASRTAAGELGSNSRSRGRIVRQQGSDAEKDDGLSPQQQSWTTEGEPRQNKRS